MVNGCLTKKYIAVFFIVTTIITSSSSSSSSSSSPSTSPSSAPFSGDVEIKEKNDRSDLLKELKEFGPDDLAKLIKAKKEKELNEFKSKILNDDEKDAGYYAKLPIVQQQEQDYQTQDQDESDQGSRKSNDDKKTIQGIGDLSALFPEGFPFAPNPGQVTTMLVKPIDRPNQMVCDCYSPGKTQQEQTNQVNPWPSISIPGNHQPAPGPLPLTPPMLPSGPFGFIGQHFAHKQRLIQRKKQFNPFSFLFMGLGKKKRQRPRPMYQPMFPMPPPQAPYSGFDQSEPPSMYPPAPGYSVKGGRKGRKKRPPSYQNLLPPPPSAAIKGKTKGRGLSTGSGNAGKWHWVMDDSREPDQGFNL